jgi:hypothetical protein
MSDLLRRDRDRRYGLTEEEQESDSDIGAQLRAAFAAKRGS